MARSVLLLPSTYPKHTGERAASLFLALPPPPSPGRSLRCNI